MTIKELARSLGMTEQMVRVATQQKLYPISTFVMRIESKNGIRAKYVVLEDAYLNWRRGNGAI